MGHTKRPCIACVVDEDVFSRIKAADESHSRARYDLSVIRALQNMFCTVKVIRAVENSSRTIDELVRVRPDVVFNLAFSIHPLEPSFVGCLEVLGVPYTGSSPCGIALANDKVRSRQLLHAAGLRVPRFVELPVNQPISMDLEPPLIVKPSRLASSAGIHADSVVSDQRHVARLVRRVWKRFELSAVCEEFIIGREFRIGLVEDKHHDFRISGISEWKFGSALPGWGFKTEAIKLSRKVRQARNVSRGPALLPKKEYAELLTICRAALKALDVRGYATVDIRMNDLRQAYVLEVNANPGLWSGGVTWSQPSFEVNLRRIVDSALSHRVRKL